MRRRLLAAAVSLVVAVLAAELGLRAAGFGDPTPPTDVVLRWDPEEPYLRRTEYSHHHKPNWSGVQRYEGAHDGAFLSEVRVETDAWGLRRTNVPADPADRVLLVLGDSVTFGQGVGGEQTFVAELDRRLDGWTVLNGGVSAWSLEQESAWYAEVGVQRAPDAVLVATYANDHDSSPMGMGSARALVQTVDGLPPPPDTGLYLLNVAQRGQQARALAERYHGAGGQEYDAVLRNLDRFERAYGRLASVDETPKQVVLLPAMTGDGPKLRAALAEVGARAERAGLGVIDATDSLDGVHPADARVHPADPHPSAKGHAAIADAIAPDVRRWLDVVAASPPQ